MVLQSNDATRKYQEQDGDYAHFHQTDPVAILTAPLLSSKVSRRGHEVCVTASFFFAHFVPFDLDFLEGLRTEIQTGWRKS